MTPLGGPTFIERRSGENSCLALLIYLADCALTRSLQPSAESSWWRPRFAVTLLVASLGPWSPRTCQYPLSIGKIELRTRDTIPERLFGIPRGGPTLLKLSEDSCLQLLRFSVDCVLTKSSQSSDSSAESLGWRFRFAPTLLVVSLEPLYPRACSS